MAAGTNKLVCAVVSVPSTASGNATVGTNPLTFRAQSPITATSTDSIVVSVTIAAIHSVTITPERYANHIRGGTVTYTHVLRNTGNGTETVTFATGFLSRYPAAAGFTSSAYVDTNANGSYDPGTDAVITTATTISLAANATQTVFVRVFAPASATTSSPADVATITATYNAGALVHLRHRHHVGHEWFAAHQGTGGGHLRCRARDRYVQHRGHPRPVPTPPPASAWLIKSRAANTTAGCHYQRRCQ